MFTVFKAYGTSRLHHGSRPNFNRLSSVSIYGKQAFVQWNNLLLTLASDLSLPLSFCLCLPGICGSDRIHGHHIIGNTGRNSRQYL